MNNNLYRKRKINLFLLACLSVFVVLLACYICSGFKVFYSTNDDYGIANFFKQGDVNSLFVNYFLSVAMVFLQKVFSEINVFVIYQLVLNVLALVLINYILLHRFGHKLGLLVVAAVGLFLGGEAFVFIQWTHTAAIGCAGGYLAIYYIFNTENDIKHKKIISALSIILILLSSCLRFNVFISVTAIFIVTAICSVVIKYIKCAKARINAPFTTVTKKYLSFWVLSVALIASMFAVNFISDAIYSSFPEYVSYKNYNQVRSNINDYSIKPYEGNEIFYNSQGVYSQNELELFRSWHNDDAKFTDDVLKEISEYSESQQSKLFDWVILKINEYIPVNPYVVLICISVFGLAAAIVLFIFRNKLKWMFPVIMVIEWLFYFALFRFHYAFILALPIALISVVTALFFNRYQYSYSLIMSSIIIFLILYMNFSRLNFRSSFAVFCPAFLFMLITLNRENIKIKILSNEKYKKILIVCMVTAMITSLSVSFGIIITSEIKTTNNFNNQFYNYIEDNNDKLFVIGCVTVGEEISKNYNSPILPPERPENVLLQAGWGVGSQSYNEKKKEYGLKNTYNDIIDNNNVYFVEIEEDIEKIEKYYNDFYADNRRNIKLKEINRFGRIIISSVVSE